MRLHQLVILSTVPLILGACQVVPVSSTPAVIQEVVEKKKVRPSRAVKYVFTENSTIGFSGSMPALKHDGGFKEFTGHFHIADGKPVGNDHKVVIDMNSTWTDNEGLTWHLKSPDFFDVEKYPQSKFDVTSVEHQGGSSWNISGNFTFHGVTKNITFPASISQGKETVSIKATFDINRKDFNIAYGHPQDTLLHEKVVIRLRLEAKPAA